MSTAEQTEHDADGQGRERRDQTNLECRTAAVERATGRRDPIRRRPAMVHGGALELGGNVDRDGGIGRDDVGQDGRQDEDGDDGKTD